ncbi:CAIB/BAIF family enzyme [Metarhizium album ARSEF 1941]|uniref:CAIB/BAIF family enzyme n=1 Tax=Metarhizium album (strain ARSEF 1941) TaxID=1081103 RepID=A0A0B2WYH6_METAS|nr:CAIB/BAIF family enzyme [Metarhizium album ARSEF 1941]KHN98639.1 CAIB/BAIF family enzyme [Metarhizium album ARSEF 1941]
MATEAHHDLPNRGSFTTRDIIHDIWATVNLPQEALAALHLPGADTGPALPSSFKIGPLAQASIALSALAARLVRSTSEAAADGGGGSLLRAVRVPAAHAVIEFKSNSLYELRRNERPLPRSSHNPVGGMHGASDGHVLIHDLLPNHVGAALELLGLPGDATRQRVAGKVAQWDKTDLEEAATGAGGAAIYALRSCLSGLRVVELTRVIAGPLAGKTLAAHGADVLWVTSPSLPTVPALDVDLGRGKRHVHLDMHDARDKQRLLELLRTCDVFVQGYRPSSLAAHGLSEEELVRANPGIICASVSAFGPAGPWARRRGFDSLVQACSGINVSEAERAGQGETSRALPCQALDHGSGYLLATGVMAAVHHRAVRGGAWRVHVSLAGTMKYLRSLGQYPGATGFAVSDYVKGENVPAETLVTTETAWGTLTAVRHSAEIEGCEVGWDLMPCPPEDNEAVWAS